MSNLIRYKSIMGFLPGAIRRLVLSMLIVPIGFIGISPLISNANAAGEAVAVVNPFLALTFWYPDHTGPLTPLEFLHFPDEVKDYDPHAEWHSWKSPVRIPYTMPWLIPSREGWCYGPIYTPWGWCVPIPYNWCNDAYQCGMTNILNLGATLAIKHARPEGGGRLDEVSHAGSPPDHYARDLCVNGAEIDYEKFDRETGEVIATGAARYDERTNGLVLGSKPRPFSCMRTVNTPNIEIPTTGSAAFSYFQNVKNEPFVKNSGKNEQLTTIYGTSNGYLQTTFFIGGVLGCPGNILGKNADGSAKFPQNATEWKAAAIRCYDYFTLYRATHQEWVLERPGLSSDDSLSQDPPQGDPELSIFNSCQPLMDGNDSINVVAGGSPAGTGFAKVLQYDRPDLDEADYSPSKYLKKAFTETFPDLPLPAFSDLIPCVVKPEDAGPIRTTDWSDFNETLAINYAISFFVETAVLGKSWLFQVFIPISNNDEYHSPGIGTPYYCPNVEKINDPTNPFSPRNDYKKSPSRPELFASAYQYNVLFQKDVTEKYGVDRDYSYQTSFFGPRDRLANTWVMGYSGFYDVTAIVDAVDSAIDSIGNIDLGVDTGSLTDLIKDGVVDAVEGKVSEYAIEGVLNSLDSAIDSAVNNTISKTISDSIGSVITATATTAAETASADLIGSAIDNLTAVDLTTEAKEILKTCLTDSVTSALTNPVTVAVDAAKSNIKSAVTNTISQPIKDAIKTFVKGIKDKNVQWGNIKSSLKGVIGSALSNVYNNAGGAASDTVRKTVDDANAAITNSKASIRNAASLAMGQATCVQGLSAATINNIKNSVNTVIDGDLINAIKTTALNALNNGIVGSGIQNTIETASSLVTNISDMIDAVQRIYEAGSDTFNSIGGDGDSGGAGGAGAGGAGAGGAGGAGGGVGGVQSSVAEIKEVFDSFLDWEKHPEVMCAIVPVDIIESRRKTFDNCIMQRINYNFVSWRRHNFLEFYYKDTLQPWTKPCVTRFYEKDNYDDCPVSMSIQQCCRILVKDVVPINYLKIRTCGGLREKRNMALGYDHIYDSASTKTTTTITSQALDRPIVIETNTSSTAISDPQKFAIDTALASIPTQKCIFTKQGRPKAETDCWIEWTEEAARNGPVMDQACGGEHNGDDPWGKFTKHPNAGGVCFNDNWGCNTDDGEWIAPMCEDIPPPVVTTTTDTTIDPSLGGKYMEVKDTASFDRAYEENLKLTLIGCDKSELGTYTDPESYRFSTYVPLSTWAEKASGLTSFLEEINTKLTELQANADELITQALEDAVAQIQQTAIPPIWATFDSARATAYSGIPVLHAIANDSLLAQKVASQRLKNARQVYDTLANVKSSKSPQQPLNFVLMAKKLVPNELIGEALAEVARAELEERITREISEQATRALKFEQDAATQTVERAENALVNAIKTVLGNVKEFVYENSNGVKRANQEIIDRIQGLRDDMQPKLAGAINAVIDSVSSNAAQIAIATSGGGGAHMPYMRWWDTGTSAGNPTHGGSFINTLGSYDAIVGVGREERTLRDAYDTDTGQQIAKLKPEQALTQPALIGRIDGWNGLKGHQMWTMRRNNLNCIGRYEKIFKLGGAENFVLAKAGSNYTTKTGKQMPWPLGWRGYINDPNNEFERHLVGPGEGGATGLDNALVGDIIIFKVNGFKRIAYVTVVNQSNPKFVKIESWDQGKFPTSTGSGISWGTGVTRTIYKNTVPKDYQKYSSMPPTEAALTVDNAQPSCEDPDFTHCKLGGAADNDTWETVKIYRPSEDTESRQCPFVDFSAISPKTQTRELTTSNFAFCVNAGYDPPDYYTAAPRKSGGYRGAGTGAIIDTTLCGPKWLGCATTDKRNVKCFPGGKPCVGSILDTSVEIPTVPPENCTQEEFDAAVRAYAAQAGVVGADAKAAQKNNADKTTSALSAIQDYNNFKAQSIEDIAKQKAADAHERADPATTQALLDDLKLVQLPPAQKELDDANAIVIPAPVTGTINQAEIDAAVAAGTTPPAPVTGTINQAEIDAAVIDKNKKVDAADIKVKEIEGQIKVIEDSIPLQDSINAAADKLLVAANELNAAHLAAVTAYNTLNDYTNNHKEDPDFDKRLPEYIKALEDANAVVEEKEASVKKSESDLDELIKPTTAVKNQQEINDKEIERLKGIKDKAIGEANTAKAEATAAIEKSNNPDVPIPPFKCPWP